MRQIWAKLRSIIIEPLNKLDPSEGSFLEEQVHFIRIQKKLPIKFLYHKPS
jgi:hypothetical protein